MFGFQSPDPVPTQEVADIICANTKFGPNVSMLIARFVRDNPEHWDRKELSKYLKKRGLKKIAERVKKEKISESAFTVKSSTEKDAIVSSDIENTFSIKSSSFTVIREK